MALEFTWAVLHAGKAYKLPNSRDSRDAYYDDFGVLELAHENVAFGFW
jgi:hypothetical protein